MAMTFSIILPWVLTHEGGFVNHPKDPGGATNRGVTQRVYDGFRQRMGQPQRSVKLISEAEVEMIYRLQYWNVIQGDRLPAGLDYAVFDYAANSGPSKAAKDLQRELGVKADGVIGQITLAAVKAVEAAGKIIDLIGRLCARRMAFLRSLSTFKHFGRGWTRRVRGDLPGFQEHDIGVIDRAILLARSGGVVPENAIPAPAQAAPGKAEPQDVSAPSVLLEAAKNPEALGLVGTITSAIGALSSTTGPIAWAVAAVMVMGAGYAIYRLVRREVTA